MTSKILSVLFLILVSCTGISSAANEKSVTVIATGNVRAEYNLCG